MNNMREWTDKSSATLSDTEDEIDLLALASVLWRGKLVIAAVALVCVLLAGLYAFRLATPMYTSEAVVSMNTQQPQIASGISSVLSALGTDNSTINTETVVIQSRNLMQKVVDKLDLVNDPEFNVTLVPPGLTTSIAIRLKSLLGSTVIQPTKQEILDAVIDKLIKQTAVTNITNSMAFNIDATTMDPNKSALIANTVAELYINDQKVKKFKATEEASKFLSTRVLELQSQLQAAQNKVKDFTVKTQLVNADNLALQQTQLKELRDRLARLRDDRVSAAKRADDLQALLANDNPAAFAAFANDPAITSLLNRLQSGAISQPDFSAAAAVLAKSAQTAVQRDDDQIAALVSSEKVMSAQIEQQSNDLITLQQLQREADSTQALYDTFLTQMKQTDVQLGLELADSQQLSSAVPRPAVSPRVGLVLVLGALLGTIVGSAFILVREMQFASFRTSDDLRDSTGLRVLGSIPMIPNKGRKDALAYLREKPTSVVAESIRNLRTSIMLSNIDAPPKVIMVTSSLPGEGKTTQSLGLAQNMASLGKRVILIEGDIRRRIFAEYFDTKHTLTLLDAMNDPAQLIAADLKQSDLGVDLLVAAKANVNAADVFTSEKFSALISFLRDHYDFVIIDTPPVLAVPDARVIGQHVDAILYTVKWDVTTKTQVRQGLEMFSTVGLKVTGLILNAIDSRQMKRYGYGGQYGYDSHGSGYYDS